MMKQTHSLESQLSTELNELSELDRSRTWIVSCDDDDDDNDDDDSDDDDDDDDGLSRDSVGVLQLLLVYFFP